MKQQSIHVYVDTNIISGLSKRDFSEDIIDGFDKMLNFRKSGKVQLWVSELVQSEIDEIPQEYRYYHNVIFRLIDNVAMNAEETIRIGPSGTSLITRGLGAPSGLGMVTRGFADSSRTKDKLLVKLEKIIPDKKSDSEKKARIHDIRHLFQCKKNSLDIFWTEDKNTILKYSTELEQLGIRVLGTLDLVDYVKES
jgi:hypothetical protein